MHWILYIFTGLQVSERLHRGPEFSHNYLIDYTIGSIMDYSKNRGVKGVFVWMFKFNTPLVGVVPLLL
jgi:hypothetical protein